MTPAQQRIADLAAWVAASSATRPAALGRDIVDNGVWAVLLPVDIDAPPSPVLALPVLALYVPASQVATTLPSSAVAPPSVALGPMEVRLRHLVWLAQDDRLPVSLIALTNPAESLRAALDRQLPGFDLAAHALVGLPVWQMAAGEDRSWVAKQLPLVR